MSDLLFLILRSIFNSIMFVVALALAAIFVLAFIILGGMPFIILGVIVGFAVTLYKTIADWL